MTTVNVELDGTAFVPQQPVDLPVGTKGTVAIAHSTAKSLVPKRRPSAEAIAEKNRYVAELNATEPYFPTVEDAIRYSRKRP